MSARLRWLRRVVELVAHGTPWRLALRIARLAEHFDALEAREAWRRAGEVRA